LAKVTSAALNTTPGCAEAGADAEVDADIDPDPMSIPPMDPLAGLEAFELQLARARPRTAAGARVRNIVFLERVIVVVRMMR